jgi:hypothetical protein
VKAMPKITHEEEMKTLSKITRTKLRGKPLETFCHKAKISNFEYGPDDNRQFCYGLVDRVNDELFEECKKCKANVKFVEESELK